VDSINKNSFDVQQCFDILKSKNTSVSSVSSKPAQNLKLAANPMPTQNLKEVQNSKPIQNSKPTQSFKPILPSFLNSGLLKTGKVLAQHKCSIRLVSK
jgi:hypothetical protein